MIYQVIVTDRDIPPIDFGGAERICFFLSQIMDGHGVNNKIIVGRDFGELVAKIRNAEIHVDDTIICHSDWITAKLLTFVDCKVFHYSHYPYAELASKIYSDKKFIFKNFGGAVNTLRTYLYIYRYIRQISKVKKSPRVTICCLSRNIEKNLKKGGIVRAQYLPNPITVPSKGERSQTTRDKILVLGKIEKRKKQSTIQQLSSLESLCFVGPAGDDAFDYSDKRYLGVLSQAELEQVFRRSLCLVLASDGEAQAQVLFEALGRGIPIVCTKSASWDFEDCRCVKVFDDIFKLVAHLHDGLVFSEDMSSECSALIKKFSDHNLYFEHFLKDVII